MSREFVHTLTAGLLFAACSAAPVLAADGSTAPGAAAPSAPAPSAPAPSAPGQPPAPANPMAGAPAPGGATRDQEISELKRIIQELQKRVEDLEKRPEPTPPVPTPPTPPDPSPTAPPGVGRGGGATLLPNISVIGNEVLGAGDTRRVPNRGRFNFSELELAFQDAVSPKMRYDVFLSAAKEEEWTLGLEEGFLTATALYPGLSARLGRIRTPFGRFNAQHPHQWPFITQPSVNGALFGPEGLVADGAVAEYVLPVRGFFARAEVGAWQTTSEAEDGLGFGAGENGAYSGRFRVGKALSRDHELEFGASRYQGNGQVRDGNRKRSLTGVDMTYRAYGKGYQRLVLSAELMNHQTRLVGDAKNAMGGFVYGTYRWDRYWEAGARLDYTRFPYPTKGYDWGGSLFLTKYITEQTSLRLEYQYTRSPQLGSGNGIYFQILFGSGPHAHNLQ